MQQVFPRTGGIRFIGSSCAYLGTTTAIGRDKDHDDVLRAFLERFRAVGILVRQLLHRHAWVLRMGSWRSAVWSKPTKHLGPPPLPHDVLRDITDTRGQHKQSMCGVEWQNRRVSRQAGRRHHGLQTHAWVSTWIARVLSHASRPWYVRTYLGTYVGVYSPEYLKTAALAVASVVVVVASCPLAMSLLVGLVVGRSSACMAVPNIHPTKRAIASHCRHNIRGPASIEQPCCN